MKRLAPVSLLVASVALASPVSADDGLAASLKSFMKKNPTVSELYDAVVWNSRGSSWVLDGDEPAMSKRTFFLSAFHWNNESLQFLKPYCPQRSGTVHKTVGGTIDLNAKPGRQRMLFNQWHSSGSTVEKAYWSIENCPRPGSVLDLYSSVARHAFRGKGGLAQDGSANEIGFHIQLSNSESLSYSRDTSFDAVRATRWTLEDAEANHMPNKACATLGFDEKTGLFGCCHSAFQDLQKVGEGRFRSEAIILGKPECASSPMGQTERRVFDALSGGFEINDNGQLVAESEYGSARAVFNPTTWRPETKGRWILGSIENAVGRNRAPTNLWNRRVDDLEPLDVTLDVSNDAMTLTANCATRVAPILMEERFAVRLGKSDTGSLSGCNPLDGAAAKMMPTVLRRLIDDGATLWLDSDDGKLRITRSGTNISDIWTFTRAQ